MNRHDEIQSYRRVLDEIAALNRRIDTLNLLIVYHATHPPLIRLIDEMKRDYQTRLDIAGRKRDRLSKRLVVK